MTNEEIATMDELMKLAARCEVVAGPDWALDKAIFSALFPDHVPSPIVIEGYGWRDDTGGWWLATGEDARTPPKTVYPNRYTASLDAAMTLVPEGWSVSIGHLPGVNWKVRAHLRDHRSGSLTKEGHSHIWEEGHHTTFTLALCAAALRARAHLKDSSHD